jgi:hypothetical protein
VKFDEKPRKTIANAVTFLQQERELEEGTPIIVVSEIHREGTSVDAILVEHA